MSRFHATPTGDVPFTAQEELDRDSEEAAALAAKTAALPELARLADIDTDIAADTQIAAARGKTIAQLNTLWTGLSAAQKDAVLKRLFIVLLRKVL